MNEFRDVQVLDTSVTHDKIGRRQPAYLIHFLRWNSRYSHCITSVTYKLNCLILPIVNVNTRVGRFKSVQFNLMISIAI